MPEATTNIDLEKVSKTVAALQPKDGKTPLFVAEEAAKYLLRFGYLDNLTKITKDTVSSAIALAQDILGVEQDGWVGEATYKQMNSLPRCGMSDALKASAGFNRWARRKADGLRYCIIDAVSGITKKQFEEAMQEAWSSWEKVCNLTLIQTNNRNNADILISASASRQEEFGQVGNVLAWAQLPQGDGFAGQLLMKFDLAETWIVDPGLRGIRLVNVACHEFGHLLGLDHSTRKTALMFPIYSDLIASPQADDDIMRIVQLYDKPVSGHPPVDPGTGPAVELPIEFTLAGDLYRGTVKKVS